MAPMSSPSFGSGYRRLDDAAEPDELLAYLDRVAALPSMARIKDAATETLSLRPGSRVLDLGCGTGVDLPAMVALTRPGGKVTGVDLSARAIGLAAERFRAWPDIEVQVADAHALPFANGSFDAVRADRILLHLDNPDRALAEIRRVLTPGGSVAILEIGMELVGESNLVEHDLYRYVCDAMSCPEHQRARITYFMPLLFARAGFSEPQIVQGVEKSAEFRAANDLFRLDSLVSHAISSKVFSPSDAGEWLSGVRHAVDTAAIEVRVHFAIYFAHGVESPT
jgi:ubiquinone/menaquinone biosynthesis C-methylase UbiE